MIVDEAGMIPRHSAAQLLFHAGAMMVLGGDEKQLPPLFRSSRQGTSVMKDLMSRNREHTLLVVSP